MGGALAMHTAFRWEQNLAGVFAFSSFLNDKSIVYEELKNSASDKCKCNHGFKFLITFWIIQTKRNTSLFQRNSAYNSLWLGLPNSKTLIQSFLLASTLSLDESRTKHKPH